MKNLRVAHTDKLTGSVLTSLRCPCLDRPVSHTLIWTSITPAYALCEWWGLEKVTNTRSSRFHFLRVGFDIFINRQRHRNVGRLQCFLLIHSDSLIAYIAGLLWQCKRTCAMQRQDESDKKVQKVHTVPLWHPVVFLNVWFKGPALSVIKLEFTHLIVIPARTTLATS